MRDTLPKVVASVPVNKRAQIQRTNQSAWLTTAVMTADALADHVDGNFNFARAHIYISRDREPINMKVRCRSVKCSLIYPSYVLAQPV